MACTVKLTMQKKFFLYVLQSDQLFPQNFLQTVKYEGENEYSNKA